MNESASDSVWQRRFERERRARREAEELLEAKSHALYSANQRLQTYVEAQGSEIVAAQAEISKLSLVARRSANGIVITDPRGRVEWTNEGFTRITGFSLAEVLGKKPGDFLQGKETNPAAIADLRTAILTQTDCSVEILNYHKDGHPYWTAVSINPIFDETGVLRNFFAIQTDITEQRKVRERLEYSEQRFRDIVASAGEYVWEIDSRGRFSYVSTYAETVLQRSRDEIIGRAVEYFAPAPTRRHLHRVVQSLFHRPRPIRHWEHTTLLPDGSTIWQRLNGVPVKDRHGRLLGFRGMARDVTAEKQVKEALVAERDFGQKVMASLGQGLVVTNADHSLRYANPRFVEWLGYASEELAKLSPEEWIDPRDRAVLRGCLESCQAGNSTSCEARLRSAQSETIEVMISGVPIFDQGAFNGAISVITDLRRRHEMERHLRQAKEEAEDLNKRLEAEIHRAEALAREADSANQAKSQFLANMSHELRTPLNAVLGMTEALLDRTFGELSPKQATSLETVQRSGSHLLELINEVLDLAKIDAGKLTLKIADNNLERFARECLRILRPLAERKRIALSLKLAMDLPERFPFDERKMRQVLLNLLGNALKFTPEEGHVSLEIHRAAQAAGSLIFSVIDDGIGIAPEDQQEVFEPFYQIDSQLSRQHEGTGLGLTLVRRIVELHGGSITLESNLHLGTRFHLCLPPNSTTASETMCAEPIAPITSASQTTPLPSDARILYAEDNEANIATLSSYLEAHKFALTVVRDGLSALAQAEALTPDLILMDIQLPEMNGLEAIRCLRATGHTAPIIAVTALASPEDRTRCLEAGATDVHSKPLQLRALLERIRELLAEPSSVGSR